MSKQMFDYINNQIPAGSHRKIVLPGITMSPEVRTNKKTVDLLASLGNFKGYKEGKDWILTNDHLDQLLKYRKDLLLGYSDYLFVWYRGFLRQLKTMVVPFGTDLVSFLSTIDVAYSNARCALKYRYLRPTLIERKGGYFNGKNVRHPIVEYLQDRQFVANDVILGVGVASGGNAGGGNMGGNIKSMNETPSGSINETTAGEQNSPDLPISSISTPISSISTPISTTMPVVSEISANFSIPSVSDVSPTTLLDSLLSNGQTSTSLHNPSNTLNNSTSHNPPTNPNNSTLHNPPPLSTVPSHNPPPSSTIPSILIPLPPYP